VSPRSACRSVGSLAGYGSPTAVMRAFQAGMFSGPFSSSGGTPSSNTPREAPSENSPAT
jgi:hypothetical protein